ncbi:RNA 3'-terminal phosphate cyclase [Planctomycetota bacterium]|nr:RNA 3'-terminal phosphate cyclase [Planctomycetota bacterium]
MLVIDGQQGEGGGQILRSSLALSMVTGTPFRIENIRAGRRKPGLMRQHLTAVRAAKKICDAYVIGDEIRSTELTFRPGTVKAGEYHFSIGTAGSTTLVLQAVLPALILANGKSTVTIEGGTHNPFAPPFDFLQKTFIPLLNRMGPTVEMTLDRHGFFPAGGGSFRVEIVPAEKLTGFDLMNRGNIVRKQATAIVANLPIDIAKRELEVIQKKLSFSTDCICYKQINDTPGPGNIVTIEIESESLCEVFTGFGEIGRAAEAVANRAIQMCQRYLKYGAPVGEYLADQILLPLAIAGRSQFHATFMSQHTQTHIDLVQKFLDCRISVDDRQRDGVTITIL